MFGYGNSNSGQSLRVYYWANSTPKNIDVKLPRPLIFVKFKHIKLQPVSYKRYFRRNNCFLLLVYTIHLSLSKGFVDPPPMGTIYMKRPLCTQKSRILKVTGHSKILIFCRVSPVRVSTRLFFCYITHFKMCPLFDKKNPQNLSQICQKGTNCEILNLNNWRLGRLKVHVQGTKKILYWWGKPYKTVKFLSDQSH